MDNLNNQKLHEKQGEVVRSSARFKVVRAGRRSGKTILKIETIFFKAVTGKDRNVFFIAPTQKQARSIVWEALKQRIGTIGEANESRLEMRVPTEDGGHSIIFIAGWENRENFRGMKAHHIEFDEIDTCKDFFIGWQEIFRPALIDTKGTAGFGGTPKKENPNLRRLEKEGDNEWAFFHFTTQDNPYIPKGEIEKARQELDANTFKQEILAEYVENEGALFKYTALLDLFSNTVIKNNEKYLTIDVAGEGSDKTIFTFWNGLEAYRIDIYDKLLTDGIINQVRESAAQERIPYSHIAVDGIGEGSGVASSPLLDGIVSFKSSYQPFKTELSIVRLPNVGYTKDAPRFTEYRNLRSQCVFTFAGLVNEHEIAIKTEDQRIKSHIIEELSNYQDASAGDGKRMATQKEDIKAAIGRSPDCFIAGTKILTSKGEKNIENISVGDFVRTPFGFSRVSYVIKKTTNELYTLDNRLTGTGNHLIFTENGFSPLDTFLMSSYTYYCYNLYNSFIWKILSLLSIKIRSIGFREMVNTFIIVYTKKTENVKKESRFTDKFGWMQTISKYLMDMIFIIRMAMFLTMNRIILNVLKRATIMQNTCVLVGQKTEKKVFLCKGCGKEYKAFRAGFCSNNCCQKFYYKTKKYHEERICILCGKKFSVRKIESTRTCSHSCAAKMRWNSRVLFNT